MKTILSILFFLSISCSLSAQNVGFKWAKGKGGSSDDYGTKIATDVSGNVYSVGGFKTTVDFNPGGPAGSLTVTGNQDIFILKTGSSGNFIWVKKIGGPYSDYVNSLLIDASGALYITGFFSGTVDFNPSVSAAYPLSTSGVADNDIFISKYDTAGNFIWAKSIGGAQNDYGYSVAEDAYQHLLITGSYRGTVDFNPGTGISMMTSAGNNDIFVARFDTAGNFNWAKSMGGSGIDYGFSAALDTFGNVYTTGVYSGTADFDPNALTYNLTVTGSATDEDIFISKLDSSGNFVWAKSIGGLNYDNGNAIAVNASGVYTTGYFWGTADFNPGSGVFNMTALSSDDIFVSKLDTAGNFKWAKRFGSTGFNGGSGIALDTSGNVYTSGTFNGVADFDPGTGIYNLTSAGSTDVFISKLDSAGNFIWAKGLGGSSGNDGSLHVDANLNVYTTGNFSGSGDFDPGNNVFTLTSFNANADLFIQKMGPCNPSASAVSVTACDSYTLNSTNYTTTGVYTQTLSNIAGCDSVVTLNLTIHYSNAFFMTQSACNSVVLNGQTYTNSGTYTQTFSNAAGCDSVITLFLTINTPTTGTLSQTACDSYTLNSQTYTASGTYTQTLTNVSGCDSNLTILLTILHSTASSLTQTGCYSYSLNGQTYTASGTYTQTLINAAGCDSVVTLSLIINPIYALANTQTACDSFTFNTQTYTVSGIYTQAYTSVAGCDSVVTLYLTVNTVNTAVAQTGITLTAVASGAGYQWVKCPSYSTINGATNQSYTASGDGDYAVIVTQNTCVDTSACFTVTGVGVADYSFAGDIHISPNPTEGLLTVNTTVNLSNASLKIMNLAGEIVLLKENMTGKKFVIDLSNQHKGLYFLEIAEGKKIMSTKITLR